MWVTTEGLSLVIKVVVTNSDVGRRCVIIIINIIIDIIISSSIDISLPDQLMWLAGGRVHAH